MDSPDKSTQVPDGPEAKAKGEDCARRVRHLIDSKGTFIVHGLSLVKLPQGVTMPQDPRRWFGLATVSTIAALASIDDDVADDEFVVFRSAAIHLGLATETTSIGTLRSLLVSANIKTEDCREEMIRALEKIDKQTGSTYAVAAKKFFLELAEQLFDADGVLHENEQAWLDEYRKQVAAMEA